MTLRLSEVWTTSAFLKRAVSENVCHRYFRIVKLWHRTSTLCSRRVCDNHQRAAAGKTRAQRWQRLRAAGFQLHISWCQHRRSRRKTLPGTVQKNRSAFTRSLSLSLQTKINNPRAEPKHIPFPESGLNFPPDAGLQRCHLGAIGWCDWVLDGLIVIGEVRPSSGIRTFTSHQSSSIIVLSSAWLLPLPFLSPVW